MDPEEEKRLQEEEEARAAAEAAAAGGGEPAPPAEGEPEKYVPEFDTEGYDQYGYDAEGKNKDGDLHPDFVGKEPEKPKADAETHPRAEPAKPAAPTRQAEPVVRAPEPPRQIWTRDKLYSADELEALKNMDLNEPGAAHEFRTNRERYYEQFSQGAFRRTMKAFTRDNPDLVARYRDDIEEVAATLNQEQRQHPDVARAVVNQVLSNRLSEDAYTEDDLEYLRERKFGKRAPEPPKKPEKKERTVPRVIPKEERIPTGRSRPTPRPSQTAGTSTTSYEAQVRATYPHWDDKSVKEYARDMMALVAAGR